MGLTLACVDCAGHRRYTNRKKEDGDLLQQKDKSKINETPTQIRVTVEQPGSEPNKQIINPLQG